MPKPVTVAVLLYGDHVQLARRCLGSIISGISTDVADVRVLMNSPCEATVQYVTSLVADGSVRRAYHWQENQLKYPVMRYLLYDAEPAIDTPYFMWFDDDSYLRNPQNTGWIDTVLSTMTHADMIGSVYNLRKWNAGLREWIRDQPWYGGVPFTALPRFITGGWWTIRTSVLRQFDWPPRELHHCGGDVALGQLLHQRRLQMKRFTQGVAINADADGKESGAARRGFTEPPLGANYKRS